MAKVPQLSVTIPLYNKEKYIARALCSVLEQTFQNFEVIIIDDGSTDNGAEVIKSISDPRIKLIQQENAGVSAARNRGIKEAHTNLIAFLDADDEWKPKFLETILRLRKKFPEAGAYATAYEEVMPGGKVVVPKFKVIPPLPWEGLIPNYFRSALGPSPVWTSAVAVPKSVFRVVGTFPIGEPLGEDLDMWGRIALKYPIAFSWEIGATYYMDAKNRACNTCSHFMEQDRPFVRTAQQAIDVGKVPSNILIDLKEYIAYCQIKAGSACLFSARKPAIARRLILNSHPKSIGLRWQQYWWYLWTFLPPSMSHFAFWIKQKVLGKG
ncbi:MAG: glycosyltransferase family 2 protein [Deltaproteobacteria bacterium]|nr:MAG: glycosyltransferase family 2 protein [Deltaproteobacteria bacterium]